MAETLARFLGEGPWATVPVEHEMSGRGVGDNIDGANGILVDSNPLQAALPLPSADEPTPYGYSTLLALLVQKSTKC